MPRSPTSRDFEDIGEAISKLIQQRYVWLFLHITRATFLDWLDSGRVTSLPTNYTFSKEDHAAGRRTVPIDPLVNLLRKSTPPLGYLDEARQVFDYDWLRTSTLIAIRGSLLLSVQSHLEVHRCEALVGKYEPQKKELFSFIRQARNVICHGDGLMNSSRLVRTSWRDITIENNGQVLKLSDHMILTLVDDAIFALATVYVDHGRVIDPISQALAISLPLPTGKS